MFAAITFDNIFSGLIGAALGVIVSFSINWWNSLRTTKDSLRLQLLRLKDYEFATTNGASDKSRERYIDTYPDILNATLAYQGLLPPFSRNKLIIAWEQYRGVTPEMKKFLKYTHNAPGDSVALDTRVNAMLAVLGCEPK